MDVRLGSELGATVIKNLGSHVTHSSSGSEAARELQQSSHAVFWRESKSKLSKAGAEGSIATSIPIAMAASVASSTIQRGQVDLIDFIDWRGIECLNHNSSHALANALKQGYRDDDGLHLESDADEQLLIYIPFTQVVKLHSIVIKGPEEEGPKTVKLFANKENMGFSNVNDYPPSDSIVLSPETLECYLIAMNYRSLTIFIEDNQGGDEITKVQKILLYGTTVDTTNMKDLKKVEEH
ncbi:uncharacterized protein A4U43_C07F32570 [Asparagus officinalis]|uniref:PITH domain-containing protein n=1 Tax=Asparagus officinalis TaxID=4686 RepID=A0A5P1EGW6_ASPOF|nr:uncharacterized protein A4U43_C07F32570 [Asparagus officinalis]